LKRFKIDMIGVDVLVYYGEKEFKSYVRRSGGMKAFKEQMGEDFSVGDFHGLTTGSMMWVSELDASTIYHELAHVIEHIMEALHVVGESEFNAYLSEYLHSVVMKWACDQKKKDEEKEIKNDRTN
jgi:hypothetical protein